MTYQDLFTQITNKQSFLCIGLDSDYQKIPSFLKTNKKSTTDIIFSFNKQLIDATHHLVIAYKINTAFYEPLGAEGWKALEETVRYIKTHYPQILVIADAKRGDIGNSSRQYAQTFFERLQADAITVAPYMGKDSVQPFMEYENKWVIVLGLTSNEGADDFQYMIDHETQTPLYKQVIAKSHQWGDQHNMMYVVGATRADQLSDIRRIIPRHFLLIPGIGAQGGTLADVVAHGMNSHCGLIVNSSRSIIFASDGKNFADVARDKAQIIQNEMKAHLRDHQLI